MKILVFIKQIPDTNDVKLDPKTGNLIRAGVAGVINPLDMHALEAAIRLKEKYGAQVTAISMGPPQADAVLKKALALGCDEAYLLSDRAFGGADTLATAYTLAKGAQKAGNFELLLFGQNSADGDTAQVGPAVAAFLDIPQVTLATGLEVEDGWVCCERSLKDSVQRVRAKLPAVVCVSREINEPRYALPADILGALEKPLTVWNAADIGADTARTGTAGSASATKRVFKPQKNSARAEMLGGGPREIAARLAELLEKG